MSSGGTTTSGGSTTSTGGSTSTGGARTGGAAGSGGTASTGGSGWAASQPRAGALARVDRPRATVVLQTLGRLMRSCAATHRVSAPTNAQPPTGG
jgi:hypothetical protein